MTRARLTICCLVGALSSCAYQPRETPWPELPDLTPVARPAPLPERPTAERCGDRLCFLPDDGETLLLIDQIARENYDLAEALAEALEAADQAQRALILAGQAEYTLSESRARQIVEERRSHWAVEAGMGAGILAALLALIAD